MVSKDGPSQVSLASIRHSRGREDCAARSGSILQERARRQRASAVLASSTGSVGTDLTDAWVVGNSPWTGEMGGCERRSPSLKAPPFCELELGHPPPSPQEKCRPILSDRLGFPPHTKTKVPLKPANQRGDSTQKRTTARNGRTRRSATNASIRARSFLK